MVVAKFISGTEPSTENLIKRQLIRDNHDNADVPNVSVTSPYKSAVLQYIAGYVVCMVRKRVNCPVCVSALSYAKRHARHLICHQRQYHAQV